MASEVPGEPRPHGEPLRAFTLVVSGTLPQSLALDEPFLSAGPRQNVRRLSWWTFGDELHGRVAVAFPQKRDEELEESAVGLGALAAEQPPHPFFDAADTLQETEIGAESLEDRKDPRALDGLVLQRIVQRGVHQVEVPRHAVASAVRGNVVFGMEGPRPGLHGRLDVPFDRGNTGLPVVGVQETEKPMERVFDIRVVGAAERWELARHGRNRRRDHGKSGSELVRATDGAVARRPAEMANAHGDVTDPVGAGEDLPEQAGLAVLQVAAQGVGA